MNYLPYYPVFVQAQWGDEKKMSRSTDPVAHRVSLKFEDHPFLLELTKKAVLQLKLAKSSLWLQLVKSGLLWLIQFQFGKQQVSLKLVSMSSDLTSFLWYITLDSDPTERGPSVYDAYFLYFHLFLVMAGCV